MSKCSAHISLKAKNPKKFESKDPEKAETDAYKYFSICKRKLDESKQRMENGAKGGRPKKSKRPPQKNRAIEKAEPFVRKEDGNLP